jgi:hypothetical protein
MSHLVLPVPQVVTSHYVIATNDPPEDPRAVVPWRVREPFRTSAAAALRSGRVAAFTVGAEEATWGFENTLAGDEDRRRIAEATHQILVVHREPVAEQPHGEQTARAVARAIADASNGVLIDPMARQVLLRDGPARDEREWFRMGDQWFGARYDVHAGDTCRTSRRTACRDDPAGGPNVNPCCSCLCITLLGLRRFGLPDLAMDGVACPHDLAALNLLRAIACRLLTDQWQWARRHPGRTVRPVDDQPKIDPDDFWTFWGATPFTDGRPLTVRLTLTSPALLQVGPPADHTGSRADWGREVLVPAMPPLIGCPADEDIAACR